MSPFRCPTVRADRVLRVLAGLLATSGAVSAWAGATTGASVHMELSGCPAGTVFATPSGTDTSQVSIAASSGAGCAMRASSFSYLGVVGASARAELVGGFGASGALRSQAGAIWQDSMRPDVPQFYRALVADLDRIELTYSVGATGGVSASQTPAPGGNLAAGSAAISYEFGIGGRWFEGRQSYAAGTGDSSSTGAWGTISGTLDLDVLVGFDGSVYFNPINLMMAGRAWADVGNSFAGGQRSAFGQADFGSTLIWNGVTSAVGVDASGNRMALPRDFRLTLTGGSGMNYWNAAVREGSQSVPEPGSAVLALLGLATLVHARRQAASAGGRRSV